MDSWVPPQQPPPQGRHPAWMEGRDRGPWREVARGRPPPHSRHNSEWFYHQYPDFRAGPLPFPDGRAEYYHPAFHPQLQDYTKPNSRAEYYESSHPNRSYSRQGYEDLYWNSVENYAYGSYQRYPQVLQSERDPRQRETWSEHANYWDQSHDRDYLHEEGSSFVRHENGTSVRSKKHNSYEDSYRSKEEDPYAASYSSPLQKKWIQDDFQRNFVENVSVPAPELPLPEEPSLLQQYKESGLSSSSYELSQYMYDASNRYEAATSLDWSPIQAAEDLPARPHPVASQKFSLPHVPVCFGAGGKLIRGCPNYPAEGQPALVEIHSLEVILHDTAEQEAMRVFPGPLIREDLHKVDVMTYCQRRAAMGCDLASSRGRDSALLWKLLLLLCRQNGSMVGSDTAELLMQDCRHRERYKRQEPAANLINLTDEEWPMQDCGTQDLLTGEIVPSAATPGQKVEKFTKLLFYGRKKEALDWAMRNRLWGHALFLSSKMDPRTYSWVLSGFTSTLAFNDPLQTLFQLMSGRIPQASVCCGDEKWGDWRPHLAVILSNQVGDAELNHRAIVTMGESLAGKGLIEAAHFCYLTVNIPFGHYGVKTDHLVLLGSSPSQTFAQFSRSECIHATEIFEYCQLLRCPQAFIPSFQVYKLIYASRLVDYGLTAQALHYCEGVGMALLAQNQNTYPILQEQVIKLSEQLKLSDPRLLEKPEGEVTLEPDWLIELRARCQQWEEEDLSSATPTHPELPRVSGSIPGLAPHSEFAQSQGCWEDLREQHPAAHLQPVASALYQPGTEQGHLHPGSGQPMDTTVAGTQTFLGTSQGSISSPGEVPDYHSPYLYQPTGSSLEFHRPYPGDQTNILQHQNALNARTRTVSESSTISMVEDISQAPEKIEEEATSEKPGVEDAEHKQVKASGSGWFSWFRSKPKKDADSSKKVSAASSDFPAPISQGKVATPPFLSPTDGTKFPPPPPISHLPHTDGNPFSQSFLGTKRPVGLRRREETTFPGAGDQVSTVAASYAGHPQRIFQQSHSPHP
ncbi:protein transport protein Sec16B isoform X3 [Hemicordylus capensis]|nr:protein transport protein Sec16B isoform X3 [Hemicordylus capensis]XP_053105697.1 protein transport protein Sec16B isoform X3 [Hemicordylus capensis]